MARIVLTLGLPKTRTDNLPVTAADITEVRLETRADAATAYTPLGNPVAPTQSTVNVDNVPGGKWWYRATWVDAKGGGNSQAETSVTVPVAGLSAGTIAAAIG